MICALNYLNDQDDYYLKAMRDPSLPTVKRRRGTAIQDNVLFYLERRCREFWRRVLHSRAPHSSAANYVEQTGNADATPLELKKVSLPTIGLAGCVQLQQVLPPDLMERYKDRENKEMFRTPTTEELTDTKRALLIMPGTYESLIAGLNE